MRNRLTGERGLKTRAPRSLARLLRLNSRRVIYRGGPILTMDAAHRVVGALLVDGDRIAAVGSEAEIRSRADRESRVVELGGRALLPGFIDAHAHFPGAGIFAVLLDLNSPPIGDVGNVETIVQRLRKRAERTPRKKWIVGMGYDDTLLAERRHPTRVDLDRASAEHPIAVWHISGHLAALNSAALERVGIDAETPDAEGGRIRRDPRTGEPDGVLEENDTHVLQPLLAPGLRDSWRIVREASRRYLAAGVTTAQNGYATESQMKGLLRLSRLGLLPLRVVLWPGQETTEALLDGRFSFASPDPSWIRVGAAKIIGDGSIQGYTGYLSAPYHVPPGDDPDYRGYPTIAREDLIRLVTRYHSEGLQVAVHGNGDACIDDILDAFEAAQRAHPRQDARHLVIHAQMARDDQLDRMADLGVIPSFFSLHTYYWGDRHREIFMGPERAARMSPARSAMDRGLRFTIHTDTPVVPMEPLRLVWAAVNRRSSSGAAIGEAQRIPPMQALRAVTIDAAYQHFEEEEKGSLEVGKLADLVILDRSPLDEPERIDEIRVLETIVGGRTVYRAKESPSPLPFP
jgi:predicted amidohydrolase YtcJ